MQLDMHFYGTYAIARCTGIPKDDARIIAYAAQFVDDSKKQDSETHPDKGMMWGVATAHHPIGCAVNANIDLSEQRRVWIPFHFLPGGEGDSLEEKLICTKDSTIANEMCSNHIDVALKNDRYGLHLLGVMSHVYMDTFSHYGFSGISSDVNTIEFGSIRYLTEPSSETKGYIERKLKEFAEKFRVEFISEIAEKGSRGLGHGAVATYPDRPYLHWECTFEKARSNHGKISERDNPTTFLEGCEMLHKQLSSFVKRNQNYDSSKIQSFLSIQGKVKDILNHQGSEEKRCERWSEFISEELGDRDVQYDPNDWEGQRELFSKGVSSASNIKLDLYKFHQAATYHRYFVLKDLLPKYEIMAY